MKKPELFFYVLIRSWNAFQWFDRCIESVLNQNYNNFQILFVDDASDYTVSQRRYIRQKLNKHVVKFNHIRKYAVCNAYEILHEYASNPEAVVLNLDGDDWLLNKDVLAHLKSIYEKNDCMFTYGECVIWDGKQLINKPSRYWKKFTNVPYPRNIVKTKSYRKYPFLPLHPRTWKVRVFNKIPKAHFMRTNNTWFWFCEDQIIYFPLLENFISKLYVSNKSLYVYNIANRLADNKINLGQQLLEENLIRNGKSVKLQGL